MFEVKKVNFKEIIILVKEADNGENFLPSVSDGTFSAENFFNENNKKISLYGSFLDNQLVGFLSIIDEKDSFISIGPMYISKKFRGLGFGEKQVKEIVNQLKQFSFKGIKTKTWGQNKASRKIFENLNFKLVEEKPNTRINGDSTVKYYLELT